MTLEALNEVKPPPYAAEAEVAEENDTLPLTLASLPSLPLPLACQQALDRAEAEVAEEERAAGAAAGAAVGTTAGVTGRRRGAVAVLIVSPTYHGAASGAYLNRGAAFRGYMK